MVLGLVLVSSRAAVAEDVTEFRYRPLVRADFRAASPPEELARHGEHLKANSCLRIAWPEGLSVQVIRRSSGMIHAVLTSPRFHATFSPSCSWMSERIEDPTDALRHEQIHFAISELAARSLTEEFEGRILRGTGRTRAMAFDQLTAEMRKLAERGQARADLEHQRFDAEVGPTGSPTVESLWARRYESAVGQVLDVVERRSPREPQE